MEQKGKIIILAVVLIAVIGIFAKPYFFTEEISNERVFAVTPKPYQAYQQALANGEPIFLEFYGSF